MFCSSTCSLSLDTTDYLPFLWGQGLGHHHVCPQNKPQLFQGWLSVPTETLLSPEGSGGVLMPHGVNFDRWDRIQKETCRYIACPFSLPNIARWLIKTEVPHILSEDILHDQSISQFPYTTMNILVTRHLVLAFAPSLTAIPFSLILCSLKLYPTSKASM